MRYKPHNCKKNHKMHAKVEPQSHVGLLLLVSLSEANLLSLFAISLSLVRRPIDIG
jgi:hypothetical protein